MTLRRLLLICFSALFVLTVGGCSAPNGVNTVGSGPVSGVSSPESLVPAQSIVSEPAPGNPAGISSAPGISSKKEEGGSEWVAYDTNKDSYKLHIKKADGTEDKVLVDDPVLAPCVAGEWVYFLSDLGTIEKVKLDGSQRTKVCGTDAIENLNGNMSITAAYQNGFILYTTQQCHEVGNNSSYPVHYYQLDPDTNQITEVKDQ